MTGAYGGSVVDIAAALMKEFKLTLVDYDTEHEFAEAQHLVNLRVKTVYPLEHDTITLNLRLPSPDTNLTGFKLTPLMRAHAEDRYVAEVKSFGSGRIIGTLQRERSK